MSTHTHPTTVRGAVAAMVGLLAMAGCVERHPIGRGGGHPAASAVSSPASATSPSSASRTTDAPSSPGPSAAAASEPLPVLPDGGDIPAGRYASLFVPTMTLTAALDGGSDVDRPGWVGLEIGSAPVLDLNIIRIDKVFDPKARGKLIDPPEDLATWLAHFPGPTVTAAPSRVMVGGIAGQQLDVLVGAKDFSYAPIDGVDIKAGEGPGGKLRIVVVKVDGHFVVIQGAVLNGYSPKDFEAVMSVFTSMIQSISWN